MSSLADKNLSKRAQNKINSITQQAQSGKISWADANKQANAVRASEGANYTVSAKGDTSYNDGSSISSNKTGNKVSGGGSASNDYSKYGGSGSAAGNAATGTTSKYNGIEYTRGNGGIYNTPTYDSAIKNYTQNGVTYQTGADMSRKPELANGYSVSNGYTVFYDKDGYATKAVKGTVDYTPHQDEYAKNGTYNTKGAWSDQEMLTAADQKKIKDIRAQLQAGKITGDQANQQANAIRAGYGYSIDKNGMVTDFGALSAVNDRRKEWGLGTNPESADQGYFRYLMGTDTSPSAYANGQVQNYADWYAQNGANYGGVSDQNYFNALGALQNAGNKLNVTNPGSYNPNTGGIISGDLNGQLNDLYTQIMNRPGFSYDLNADMLYQQYKDQYVNQGQQAMKDTMGQAAALTGGYGSSYGQSVGQQQYDAYLQRLNEVIPDLYDRAYQQYKDEGDVLMQQYGIAKDAEGTAYDRYIDQRNWAYQLGRDQIADSRYEQEYADSRADVKYDRNMTEAEKARAQLEDHAKTMAVYGDFSGYKALGYSDSEINIMRVAYEQELAAAKAKGSGGRSSSSVGGGGGNDSGSSDGDYDGLFLAAKKSGAPKSYISNHYKEYGFSKSTGLTSDYATWQEYNAHSPGGSLPQYSTIAEESKAGLYGPKYGMVLSMVQAMYGSKKSEETISKYLNSKLDDGSINVDGMETILKAFGY